MLFMPRLVLGLVKKGADGIISFICTRLTLAANYELLTVATGKTKEWIAANLSQKLIIKA